MEETVKKRDWVKNAAIIFLSVMLVLTFFSNTILNRSLPEVSTQQVAYGTINTKIRGSGTVTANTTYEVMLEQTRTVDSVLVKNGQEVAAGEVLFTLKASDSVELDTAKKDLENAELEYKISQLEAGMGGSDPTSDAAQSARQEYNAATAERKKIEAALGKLDGAQKAVAEAQAAVDTAKAHLDVLAGSEENLAEIVKLKELLAEAEANYAAAEEGSDTAKAWAEAVAKYTADLETYQVPATKYNTLYTAYVTSQENLASASANLSSIKSSSGDYDSADLAAAQSAELAAKNAYNSAADALDDAVHDERIQNQIDALKNSQTEKHIQELREKVNELSAKDEGNEITAKVAGVIGDLNITSGSIIQPETAVATIQQNDRGYSVKISVTAEQAKKVNIGDTAEVGNYYWWGDAITAVLSNIAPDPTSAGRNKFLVFDVDGEVDVGTNLEISIGQKSANYDAIVPNSALRNDTNGDFIFAVTLKSSPLGNRYVATRVDVKILAKDDTSAAITGIASGEYVITTSSEPIEAGQLVRMAEG